MLHWRRRYLYRVWRGRRQTEVIHTTVNARSSLSHAHSCLCLFRVPTYDYHPFFALARFNLLRSVYRKSRMAAPGSFLDSISPWSTRSNTPKPGQGKELEPSKLSNQQGADHSIGNRHRLSISQYPKDCPPSQVRWFYAVDVSSQLRYYPYPGLL